MADAGEFLSIFAIACVLIASLGVGSLAGLVAWTLKSRLTYTDRFVVMWLVYNALTHFILVRYSLPHISLAHAAPPLSFCVGGAG